MISQVLAKERFTIIGRHFIPLEEKARFYCPAVREHDVNDQLNTFEYVEKIDLPCNKAAYVYECAGCGNKSDLETLQQYTAFQNEMAAKKQVKALENPQK